MRKTIFILAAGLLFTTTATAAPKRIPTALNGTYAVRGPDFRATWTLKVAKRSATFSQVHRDTSEGGNGVLAGFSEKLKSRTILFGSGVRETYKLTPTKRGFTYLRTGVFPDNREVHTSYMKKEFSLDAKRNLRMTYRIKTPTGALKATELFTGKRK